MPRIGISISDDDHKWLSEHPTVSPSGLFQEALRELREKRYNDNKNQIRTEIIWRITQLQPILRVRVLLNDTCKSYSFGPAYPLEDISKLVNWIQTQNQGIKRNKEFQTTTRSPIPAYINKIPNEPDEPYAWVTFIFEPDGEKTPIVEFLSQIKK